MKNDKINKASENCADEAAPSCRNRREFLVAATVAAEGILLSLAGAKSAFGQTAVKKPDTPAAPVQAEDMTIKIGADSPLNTVGGFETVDTKVGKVTIIRDSPTSFRSFLAVCTHKGGPANYDQAKGEFVCPWHNSHFDSKGQVTKGPAKNPLKAYSTEQEIVLNLSK